MSAMRWSQCNTERPTRRLPQGIVIATQGGKAHQNCFSFGTRPSHRRVTCFRDLIPHLADDVHIVAPDLPGFWPIDMPAARNSATTRLSHSE